MNDPIVIVASRLQGGQVRIMDAEFDNLAQLNDWMRDAVPRAAFHVTDAPAPFHFGRF